jgi:hypothetical protein
MPARRIGDNRIDGRTPDAAGVDVQLTERLAGRSPAILAGNRGRPAAGDRRWMLAAGASRALLRAPGTGGRLARRGGRPCGPDGGRGSLEAYIGGPALMRRWGDPAAIAAGAG